MEAKEQRRRPWGFSCWANKGKKKKRYNSKTAETTALLASLAALRDRAHAAGVSTKALDDVEVGWRGMSHDDEVISTACRRLFSLGCVLTPVGLCRRGR